MFNKPVFDCNEGNLRVENPDGVFVSTPHDHSLYNTAGVCLPVIPGDWDTNVDLYPANVRSKP